MNSPISDYHILGSLGSGAGEFMVEKSGVGMSKYPFKKGVNFDFQQLIWGFMPLNSQFSSVFILLFRHVIHF